MWSQGVGWQDHSMCWKTAIFLSRWVCVCSSGLFKTCDGASQRVCGGEVNLWGFPSSFPSCWFHAGQCGEEVGVRRAWQPQTIARAAGWSYRAKNRVEGRQGSRMTHRITTPAGLEDSGYTWCGDQFWQVQPEFCSLSSGESEKLPQHHWLFHSAACLAPCCSPSGAAWADSKKWKMGQLSEWLRETQQVAGGGCAQEKQKPGNT